MNTADREVESEDGFSICIKLHSSSWTWPKIESPLYSGISIAAKMWMAIVQIEQQLLLRQCCKLWATVEWCWQSVHSVPTGHTNERCPCTKKASWVRLWIVVSLRQKRSLRFPSADEHRLMLMMLVCQLIYNNNHWTQKSPTRFKNLWLFIDPLTMLVPATSSWWTH